MIMKITFFQQWRPAWPCNEKASANLLRNFTAQNLASVVPIRNATSTCITQTPKCFLHNSVCDLYDPKPHSKSVWRMTFGSFWAAHIIALHLWRQAYAPFRHKNQHSDSDLYDLTQCRIVCGLHSIWVIFSSKKFVGTFRALGKSIRYLSPTFPRQPSSHFLSEWVVLTYQGTKVFIW